MANIEWSPGARLFWELLAAWLKIKVLERELADLKAQPARLEASGEV
jgi:hypothetical protein